MQLLKINHMKNNPYLNGKTNNINWVINRKADKRGVNFYKAMKDLRKTFTDLTLVEIYTMFFKDCILESN